LGNYLLKEHFAPAMHYELALAIAIKITKDAATYIEGCDGPIKAALIQPPELTNAAKALEPNPSSLFNPERNLCKRECFRRLEYADEFTVGQQGNWTWNLFSVWDFSPLFLVYAAGPSLFFSFGLRFHNSRQPLQVVSHCFER
jgi:hypothetical protein